LEKICSKGKCFLWQNIAEIAEIRLAFFKFNLHLHKNNCWAKESREFPVWMISPAYCARTSIAKCTEIKTENFDCAILGFSITLRYIIYEKTLNKKVKQEFRLIYKFLVKRPSVRQPESMVKAVIFHKFLINISTSWNGYLIFNQNHWWAIILFWMIRSMNCYAEIARCFVVYIVKMFTKICT
jgi:hypothetical protein